MKTEQNKLEKEFAKKLNSREIAPSSAAWDRLDAMLTVTEDKKPVRKLNWLYIAAGLIGILLMVSVFLLLTGKENTREDAVVIEENTQPAIENTNNSTIDSIKQIHQSVPVHQKLAEQATQNEVVNKKDLDKSQNPSPVQNQPVNQIANNIIESNNLEKSEPKTIIAVHDLPKVDVGQMLAEAEKSSIKKASVLAVKVDPNSLLSQVDGELDLSFREKVIKSVTKNYKNVKVALANRNNEK